MLLEELLSSSLELDDVSELDVDKLERQNLFTVCEVGVVIYWNYIPVEHIQSNNCQ